MMQVFQHSGAPVSAVNQVWTISSTATGGSFELAVTVNGITETTGSIAYNATAATIQTAVQALSNVGAGNITGGGGALPGTPVTLTGASELAGTPFTVAVIDSSSGGSTTIANTTPGLLATERGARPGQLLLDITNAVLYENTGTRLAPTWTKVQIIAQQSAITALTDSTGGSASGTLAAITAGASYAQADMVAAKNAIASLAAQVELLRAALHASGVTT